MKHKRSTMEFLVSCVAFGMLFLGSIIPSTTAVSQILDVTGVRYEGDSDVHQGKPFKVVCKVGLAEPILWYKDGSKLTTKSLDAASLDTTAEFMTDEIRANETVIATLSVLRAKPSHTGQYQCNSQFSETHSLRVSPDNTIKALVDFQNIKVYNHNRPLTLGCNVTMDSDKKYDLEWLKNDKSLSADPKLKDRYQIKSDENKLVIKTANEDDYGNYTCRIAGNSELSATIQAVMVPTAHLPKNISVVEGEKLTINCIVHGKPTPDIYWIIGENDTYTESRDRVTLTENTAGVPNAALVIEGVRREDRNRYRCIVQNIANQDGNGITDETYLVVKDKLAALWPFLGICAEVFVLCTIILVYEKRRNKPELEESDTDQSPDPKKS